MTTTIRRGRALRAVRTGAVALGVAALGLTALTPPAHAADEGTVALCVTDSTGNNFVPRSDQAWYQVAGGYVKYLGAPDTTDCRESQVPGGSAVTVWAMKDGTSTAKKTVTVPSGETLRVNYYTSKVTINYAGQVAFGGPQGDSAWFQKPSMELFSDGVNPTWFRVNLTNNRVARTPISWPVAQTTGKSVTKTIAVVEVLNGAGDPFPGVTVEYNKNNGPNFMWVKDDDGNLRKTGADGLLAYPIDGNVPDVTQRVSINQSAARATYDATTKRYDTFQSTNVVMNYQHLVRYRQGGTPEIGQTHFWLTKSGMELFPGDYSFEFQVPDKKLGTAKQSYPGLTLTLEPGKVVKTAAAVRFTDSAGDGVSDGTVSYYRNTAWHSPTDSATDGPGGTWVTLFDGAPGNIVFALRYQGAIQQLATQNLASKSVGYFQSVPVTVKLVDHAGQPLDTGSASYYASSWQTFGDTTNGSVTKELLPVRHSLAMTYLGSRQQVTVNPVSTTPVVFQTGKITSSDDSVGSYYTTSWRSFPADGVELLPSNVTVRMTDNSQRTVTPVAGSVTDVTASVDQ